MNKLFIIGPVDRMIGGSTSSIGEALETEITERLERDKPCTEYGCGRWRIDSVTINHTTYDVDGITYEAMTAAILAHDDYSER